MQVQAIDGRRVASYDLYRLSTSLEDYNKVRKSEEVEFHAVDMRGYDIILGYPWLNIVNPDLRWREGIWVYHDEVPLAAKQVTLALCAVEQFPEFALDKANQAYVSMPYNWYLSSGCRSTQIESLLAVVQCKLRNRSYLNLFKS